MKSLIVEVAGIPRSGKTTTIDIVKDYFRRQGYGIKILKENFPFGSLHRLEMATWNANHALNSLLDVRLNNQPKTIIFQDRMLFDAIVFLKLLETEKILESTCSDSYKVITSKKEINQQVRFLSRWTSLIDLIVLFTATPKTSVERDVAAQLGSGSGIITNDKTILKLTQTYKSVIRNQKGNLPYIMHLDTTNKSPAEVAHVFIDAVQKYTTKI